MLWQIDSDRFRRLAAAVAGFQRRRWRSCLLLNTHIAVAGRNSFYDLVRQYVKN
jgi:hypothetical protein